MAEPNNSISDAQTFKFETIYKDSIATASDVDYFKIDQVSNPSQISIDFTGLSSTSSNNEFNISQSLMRQCGISFWIFYGNGYNISKTLKSSLAKDTPYYLKVAKGDRIFDKELFCHSISCYNCRGCRRKKCK